MKITIREKNTAYVELCITTFAEKYYLLLADNGKIAFSDAMNSEKARGIFNGKEWEIYPKDHEAAVILEMFV